MPEKESLIFYIADQIVIFFITFIPIIKATIPWKNIKAVPNIKAVEAKARYCSTPRSLSFHHKIMRK